MGILSVGGREDEEGLLLGERAGEVGIVSICIRKVRANRSYVPV